MIEWIKAGEENGWTMPTAPKWKKIPVIRHIRTFYNFFWTEVWYSSGPGMIGLRTGYDEWVLWGMWRGLER